MARNFPSGYKKKTTKKKTKPLEEHVPLPEEFIARILIQFGDDATDLLESLQTRPSTSVHLHPTKSNGLHIDAENIAWCTLGRLYASRPSFTLDPFFHAGCYYPQESSSMIIAWITEQLFGNNAAIQCLDFCASPGGKSLLLSDLIGEKGKLFSNEINRTRNTILRENLTKWGVANYIVTQNDSSTFASTEIQFDLILIDAPCSGEGMFRKDDRARSEWSPANVAMCATRQKDILNDMIQCLAPGGVLIYSTCTFASEENEENCIWLFDQGLEAIHLSPPKDWNIHTIQTNKFTGMQFLPHRTPGEGFFVSAFRKSTDVVTSGKTRSKSTNWWRELSKSEKALLSGFNLPDHLLYSMTQKGEIHASSFSFKELNELATALFITQPGQLIGSISRDNFIPDHGLAMLSAPEKNQSSVDLHLDQALAFLRKEHFDLQSIPSSWTLVTFQNKALGWIKGIGTRFNNYYPKEWRIRMK